MVAFGDITVNGTIIYTGTKTDEMMNYVCAGVLIGYMVVGLIVNLLLIYYYKDNRPSWIDRHLFYISLARPVFLTSSCILASYILLNDRDFSQIMSFRWWEIALNIVGILSSVALISFDTVIVAMQYSNIHCPLWTILNGSSKLIKSAVIIIGFLFAGCNTAAIIYGQKNRNKEIFLVPLLNEAVIDNAISTVPFIIVCSIVAVIYLATWIRFWYQTGEIRVARMVKREFKLVTMLVFSDIIGAASFVVFSVNLYILSKTNISQSVYIWFFSGTFVPQTASMVVACYMVMSERGIREKLFGRCCRG